MGLAGRKRSGGGGRGGGRGRERRRFRRHSSHASPPSFFPASGYLLIGYSKISETRRYRRRKRGDAREDENRRKREKEDERLRRRRGVEREGTGGRVVADRTRGWGLTTTTPKDAAFFLFPRVPFCFFPRCPTPPTHPPSESFDSSARLCHPLTLSSSCSSFSSSSSSYHRPPKIRVRYYLSPDRSRSTTPANVLFRFLASRSYSPARHSRPTITGPRTI